MKSLIHSSSLLTKVSAAFFAASIIGSKASVVLQYDSDLTQSVNPLVVFGTPDSSLISSQDTGITLGGNTFHGGTFLDSNSNSQTVAEGNTQTNTVNASNSNGGDRFFMFGGYLETLNGSLADASANDGEWIGASFTAAQTIEVTNFDYQLFVNNSGQHAARDSGLFISVDGGGFTQFGLSNDQSSNGNRGVITFADSVILQAGETLEWRLAFTDRTRVANNLPATRTTRIGDIQISATAIPEPSSMILGLLGLSSLLIRRRM